MHGALARPLLALAAVIALPAFATAQTTTQFWGSLTAEWVRSESRTYAVEFEPKVLLSAPPGEPTWASIDVTPGADFALKPWLDAVAELATGYTSQTDDLDTFELSPRGGVRFHLTSRDLPTGPLARERVPRHRVVIRNLVRAEQRNLFANDGSGVESSVRFRNRVELQVPLNRERVSDVGARFIMADWEWFIPIGDPTERFAGRQRVRAGLGYRQGAAWRLDALYIWNRSRDTTQDDFTTSDNIVSIRINRRF